MNTSEKIKVLEESLGKSFLEKCCNSTSQRICFLDSLSWVSEDYLRDLPEEDLPQLIEELRLKK